MSNYIDIPLDLWNEKLPKNDSFLTDSVDWGKVVLIDGNYPIKSATFMTSDLNQVFTFTHKEGIPKMFPLMFFRTSVEENNQTPAIELSLFCYEGYKFSVISCEILPLLTTNGFDFKLLAADEGWLDEDGGMSIEKCLLVSKMLTIIVYVSSKMLSSRTSYEAVKDQKSNSVKKNNKNNHTLTNIIRIGNREIKVYGHKNKSYVRKTDSWAVRGHFRHYKSGKTVFIPEYQKGNKKIDNVRTYQI